MTNALWSFRRVLRSTALCGVAFTLIAPLAASAFDPNEGANDASTSSATSVRRRLPSTAPLVAPMPKLNFAPADAMPLVSYPDGTVSAPQARQIPSENPGAPAPVAAAPQAVGFPQPVPETAPAAAITFAPALPPVDEATAARAAQEMQASGTPVGSGFIAPAPLSAAALPPAVISHPTAPGMPEPLAPMPLSAMDTAVPPPAPEKLSDATKNIISKIPSHIDSAKPKSGKLGINRMSPTVQDLDVKSGKIETFDAVGLSIKVKKPGIDTGYELNNAYNALMAGENQQAIETYKKVLASNPENQDALFGIASIYHRTGDIEHARPYYAQLLKVNPMHKEGLNNFLALMSDEAPQEALAELDRLEQRNPDFSPIPAQQSLVLSKLGYIDQAREKMLRAIELSPENLTYKYNLAVMLDKNGDYTNAADLYRLLIDASLKGAKVPASLEVLQKRLNFISLANVPAPVKPAFVATGS